MPPSPLHPRPRPFARRLVGLFVLVVGWSALVATPVDAAGPHRWPVAPAVVTRTFTDLAEDWLPGHRGVDLAVDQGDAVHATASGTVVFAGSVVGVRWVSLDHGAGLRTTLGPLAEVRVAVGDLLDRGDVVGTAAAGSAHDGLHWSARRDGRYIDPRSLVQTLVPRLVGSGGWEPREPAVARWLSPPNGNQVIGVAGLLTSTGSTALDLQHLGYRPEDVTHLSHAGRLDVADPDPQDPLRDQAPWRPADTFGGVERAARLLEAQLRAQWARSPGVGVDLVGHSFGGVVVLHYLLAIHDPRDPGLPPIGHAVTLAAPLQGADLASAASNPSSLGLLAGAVDLAGLAFGGGLDPETLQDLEVGSPLLRDLAESWQAAATDPWRSPLASGTRLLTIGGATDLVVPEHRTTLPGAAHRTIPGGHTAAHTSDVVNEVVRAFLADQDVPALAGAGPWWPSGGISLAEQLVGVAL